MSKRKLPKKIERSYSGLGVDIRLVPEDYLSNSKADIFRLKLKLGTRADAIFARAHDVRLALRLPFLEPFYSDNDVYLAVSDKVCPQNNSLRNMLNSAVFRKGESPLLFALGYTMMGKMIFEDLGKLPHILYAGSTNSGKSVGLTNLCLCLSVRNTPDEVSIVIIDTGADTLDVFSELPHLACPIVKDTETALYVIIALACEMERRMELDEEERNTLPKIVCIIDEYPSLANNLGSQQLVVLVSDLLQRGRHAGIHMVISAQDPTSDNMMKTKLNNITARAAFACAKHQQSATILGKGGAERLTGKGAMLFVSSEFSEPIRLQGAYMPKNEVKELVERIKLAFTYANRGFVIQELNEEDKSMKISEYLSTMPFEDDGKEQELADVIVWALTRDTVSESKIKENFRMGNRAGDILDKLYEMGIVSEKFANQPRKVLIKSFSDIPDNVIGFLRKNGYTETQIASIFNKKEEKHDDRNQTRDDKNGH